MAEIVLRQIETTEKMLTDLCNKNQIDIFNLSNDKVSNNNAPLQLSPKDACCQLQLQLTQLAEILFSIYATLFTDKVSNSRLEILTRFASTDGLLNEAFQLAERFRDFRSLSQLTCQFHSQPRVCLVDYLNAFGRPFAHSLFDWFFQQGITLITLTLTDDYYNRRSV